MTNKEAFKEFGNVPYAVEEILWDLATSYAKALGIEKPVVNPVGFVKNFMKQECMVNEKYARMANQDNQNTTVIDVTYTEVDEAEKTLQEIK